MSKIKKSKSKNFKSFDEVVDPTQLESTDAVRDISAKPTFDFKFKNGVQKLAWNIYQNHDIVFLLGAAGSGKALPLNAKLYKRSGPISMGEVQIGDEIANPDGGFTKVTGIYPQGKKQIYRVFFHDHTFVDCCEDHLWQVSSISGRWKDKIVNTKFILENCRTPLGRKKLYIKATKPVNFESKEFLISPYLMGILISEGCLRGPNCCFSTVEHEVLNTVSNYLDYGYKCKSSNGTDHRIVKNKQNCKQNVYKEELKKLNLWNKFSYEKFIPQIYLYGDTTQRVSLLQGLMDGDGTVNKEGSISYSTTSYELAKDLCQLVYSLGGITKINIKEKCGYKNSDGVYVVCKPSYICNLNLPNDIKMFLLSRKLRRVKARTKYFPKRYIDRVEILDKETEMQCISVDHKDQLYLTDNYTVTHNTFLSSAFAVSEILNKTKKKIVLTRPIVEAGERLGFLPGTADEKIDPYMRPLWDCLDKICGPSADSNKNRNLINRSYEVAPLAFMRGVTWDNSVCILDEAQNCTRTQLKLFLTRMGENTKIIITGDPKQSDLGGIPDLIDVVSRLESAAGIGIIYFNEDCIVRHPLVGEVIKRLEK